MTDPIKSSSDIAFASVTVDKEILTFFADYLVHHKNLNKAERRVYVQYLNRLANPVVITNQSLEMEL